MENRGENLQNTNLSGQNKDLNIRLNKSKLFIVLVGIIFVIIGAGGYILGVKQNRSSDLYQEKITSTTPQPSSKKDSDETASWKTYANSTYGYSIKYPSDQLVRMICPGEELVLQKRGPGTEQLDEKPLETCGRGGRFDVEVQTFETPLVEQKSDSNYIVSKETATIAGITADKYTTTPTTDCIGICAPQWIEEIRL